MDNTTFEFILTLPKLEFLGKYNVKMRILIDFAGAGDMQGIFGKFSNNLLYDVVDFIMIFINRKCKSSS